MYNQNKNHYLLFVNKKLDMFLLAPKILLETIKAEVNFVVKISLWHSVDDRNFEFKIKRNINLKFVSTDTRIAQRTSK